jgi:Prokaryotic Cytochrome C oxidase subunit IV
MTMPDRLDITWIVLIGLALATLLLPSLLPRPLLANALVLVLAAIKGRRIALDFLDLRAAPALWRGLVSAWIVILVLFAWFASAIVTLI